MEVLAADEGIAGHRQQTVMRSSDEGSFAAIPLHDLFVSIDLDRNTAHVVYSHSSALHWEELSRANAEMLVTMGVRAQIHLSSPSPAAARDPLTRCNEPQGGH